MQVVRKKRLGMNLAVFAKNYLREHIRNVEKDVQNTGLFGILPNKV